MSPALESIDTTNRARRNTPNLKYVQSFPSTSPSQRNLPAIPNSKHTQSCHNAPESKAACDASMRLSHSSLDQQAKWEPERELSQQDRASAAEAFGMEMTDMPLDPIKAPIRADDSMRQLCFARRLHTHLLEDLEGCAGVLHLETAAALECHEQQTAVAALWLEDVTPSHETV